MKIIRRRRKRRGRGKTEFAVAAAVDLVNALRCALVFPSARPPTTPPTLNIPNCRPDKRPFCSVRLAFRKALS